MLKIETIRKHLSTGSDEAGDANFLLTTLTELLGFSLEVHVVRSYSGSHTVRALVPAGTSIFKSIDDAQSAINNAKINNLKDYEKLVNHIVDELYKQEK